MDRRESGGPGTALVDVQTTCVTSPPVQSWWIISQSFNQSFYSTHVKDASLTLKLKFGNQHSSCNSRTCLRARGLLAPSMRGTIKQFSAHFAIRTRAGALCGRVVDYFLDLFGQLRCCQMLGFLPTCRNSRLIFRHGRDVGTRMVFNTKCRSRRLGILSARIRTSRRLMK